MQAKVSVMSPGLLSGQYFSVIKLSVTTSIEIQIKQAVYMLEYQVIIHEIFIACMMNKEYCITKANIDEEESKMQDLLMYFAEWKQEQQEFRKTEAILPCRTDVHKPMSHDCRLLPLCSYSIGSCRWPRVCSSFTLQYRLYFCGYVISIETLCVILVEESAAEMQSEQLQMKN
jgi:hypothetical protein